MNEFEKAKYVRHTLATRASEIALYDKWPADFGKRQIQELVEGLAERFRGISMRDFTTPMCAELDFGRWTKESPLRLIPIWMYPFLKYGDPVICIDNSIIFVTRHYKTVRPEFDGRNEDFSKKSTQTYIDNDHRGGYLAYGIIPND